MMERLLGSPLNVNTDSFYDDAIDEFSKLNDLRTVYLHGLWRTTADAKKTEIAAPKGDPMQGFLGWRRVTLKELNLVTERMRTLNLSVLKRASVDLNVRYGRQKELERTHARASRESPQPPHTDAKQGPPPPPSPASIPVVIGGRKKKAKRKK
jgi:hypothetical protein